MPPLSDKAISLAKPKEKPYRLYDREGMYIEIAPSGGKYWRAKYRFEGKETRLSLGVYPLVGLKEAREKNRLLRKKLSDGVDPGKKELPPVQSQFQYVCRERWERYANHDSRNAGVVWRRIEREILPFIGAMPIDKITAPDILAILRRIEGRGTIEIAHKVKCHISQVFDYAIACGLVFANPARDLSRALKPIRNKPMAAIIDPREAGALMRAIGSYPAGIVKCALQLSALTFVRPGELRKGLWSGIDFERQEWRLSAEEMKMKKPHIVPLSRQAIEVLRRLHGFSGHGVYLFPSIRTLTRPMSDMTVGAALKALGYGSDKMTPHGFRAMATSLLAEQGWSGDAIERQLAHTERNKVRAAYHRSEHLEERRKMMQAWADYLDTLAAS